MTATMPETMPDTETAPDPLHHVRPGDPVIDGQTSEGDGRTYCNARHATGRSGRCTRDPGHPGQHIAGMGTTSVMSVWLDGGPILTDVRNPDEDDLAQYVAAQVAAGHVLDLTPTGPRVILAPDLIDHDGDLNLVIGIGSDGEPRYALFSHLSVDMPDEDDPSQDTEPFTDEAVERERAERIAALDNGITRELDEHKTRVRVEESWGVRSERPRTVPLPAELAQVAETQAAQDQVARTLALHQRLRQTATETVPSEEGPAPAPVSPDDVPADPLADVRPGGWAVEAYDRTRRCRDSRRLDYNTFECTRTPGHPGQHIMVDSGQGLVSAVWITGGSGLARGHLTPAEDAYDAEMAAKGYPIKAYDVPVMPELPEELPEDAPADERIARLQERQRIAEEFLATFKAATRVQVIDGRRRGTWCESGTTEVLRHLDLPLLRQERIVTVIVEVRIPDAASDDSAVTKARNLVQRATAELPGGEASVREIRADRHNVRRGSYTE